MIELLITLVILGVISYFVEMIPMSAPFHTAVRIVAVVFALLTILKHFGYNLL